ncbi:MAG TPA: DUF1800 domain-containing protein [Steroidobacteraceae bacterium]|jgi:uncharacterized protein (DUF1800 family)|nr:DUF1800 domain-containing protein [Steroidobacteraceae bacterium]
MLAISALFSACGGGGGSDGSASAPTAPIVPLATANDAARLLDQATFGVTASDLAHAQSIGISAYLNEQFAAPATQYTGYTYTPHTAPADCVTDTATPTDASSLCARDQYSPFQVQRDFFTHALNNPDQLRQRVAYALSQIFVVSSVEIYEAYGLAAYQNLLLSDAFGNFRALLQDVTLSPVMGHYLDMVDNDKPNPVNGTTPNENYAREVLQLFSIGLYQLNADGTQQLDSTGAPIPTYAQATIEGFSSVFTGWTYPALPGANSTWANPVNFNGTMVAFADHHDDTDPKPLLNGYTVPPNQTPEQDLTNALDNIFNHPNVGPFIGKQLIQHLVTSNPSPAYVARVAAVFANDGTGVRGNLAAVVRAILTDTEARGDQPAGNGFGRLREPALFITATLRSLGGQSDGVYLRGASSNMGQPIFSPETVFNFYPPSYQIPGTQTLAPEFGIDNAATALARANFINTVIMQSGAAADPTVTGSTGTSISLAPFASTTEPAALIAQLNQVLMHGSLAADASNVMLGALQAVTSTDPTAPARVASYLILSSGQYQVER